ELRQPQGGGPGGEVQGPGLPDAVRHRPGGRRPRRPRRQLADAQGGGRHVGGTAAEGEAVRGSLPPREMNPQARESKRQAFCPPLAFPFLCSRGRGAPGTATITPAGKGLTSLKRQRRPFAGASGLCVTFFLAGIITPSPLPRRSGEEGARPLLAVDGGAG